MAKIKMLAVAVLTALSLTLSGCDGVTYNNDTSTWKAESVSAKGGLICVAIPDAATCK